MKQSFAHHHHKEEEEVFRFSNTQVSSFAVTSLDRGIVNLGMAVVFPLGTFLRQNYRRLGDWHFAFSCVPHKSRRCARPHHHNHLEKQVFASGSKLPLGYSWDKKSQKSCSLRKDKQEKQMEMALCAPAPILRICTSWYVLFKESAAGASRLRREAPQKAKQTVILEYGGVAFAGLPKSPTLTRQVFSATFEIGTRLGALRAPDFSWTIKRKPHFHHYTQVFGIKFW